MSFFALPHRVLLHDTTAYGMEHFLTDFRLQCEARELLLFDHVLDDSPEGRLARESLAFVTREAYSRYLAPVRLGERVGLLMSFEDPSFSSFRLCFRLVRHDGVPVCAGFQTVVTTSRATGDIVPAPPSLLRFNRTLRERLRGPSFAERLQAGEIEDLFPDNIAALGREVALTDPQKPGPRFRDTDPELRVVSDEDSGPRRERKRVANPPSDRSDVVFVFPGQGSYHPAVLRDFLQQGGELAELIHEADATCRDLLGRSVVAMVKAADEAEHDRLLAEEPDLAQVAMFLSGVLIARTLVARGLRPGLMMGHSAGELAALCAGGAFSWRDGVMLVCERVRALRAMGTELGGMVVLGCNQTTAQALVDALELPDLHLAIVNHERQVAVAGAGDSLRGLVAHARRAKVRVSRLSVPYPYHSSMLAPAVKPFAEAIREIAFQPTQIPVYSPIEKALHVSGPNLSEALASHLSRPFRFDEAMRTAWYLGARSFVQCGGSEGFARLLRRTLAGERGVTVHNPTALGATMDTGVGVPMGAGAGAGGGAAAGAPKLSVVRPRAGLVALNGGVHGEAADTIPDGGAAERLAALVHDVDADDDDDGRDGADPEDSLTPPN